MSGHTPGPWSVDEYVGGNVYSGRYPGCAVMCRDNNKVVCEIPDYTLGDFDRQDARLIAAAPDSHEANIKFVEAIESLFGITPAWSDERIYDELPSSGLALAYFAARAAIAKATQP